MVKHNVSFHGGNSKYSSGGAAAARVILTGSPNNWTITDGGEKTGQKITTRTATDITPFSAVLGGEVISQTKLFTERGVVWGRDSEPTLENHLGKTTEGEGLGNFSITVSELSEHTAYYVRAYALHNTAILYGENVMFRTKKIPIILSGNFTAKDKYYDGSIEAQIDEDNLVVLGTRTEDNISIARIVLAFEDAKIGTGKTIRIKDAIFTGKNLYNYSFSRNHLPTTTASITKKELLVNGTFKALDKQYDGTKVVQIKENNLTIEGVIEGEEAYLTNVFAFENENSGIEKTVLIKSPKLTGAHAGNYSISKSQMPTSTASITPKILTMLGSFTLFDNQYDGTTAAILKENNLFLSGIIDNDDVSIGDIHIEYTDAEVRTGKRAYIQSVKLTGADADNYSVSYAKLVSAAAETIPKELTLSGSFTARDKFYDGTTDAQISKNNLTLDGIISYEDVALDDIFFAFDNNSIDTGKKVTIDSASLKGDDAGNYSLSLINAPTDTASITTKEISIDGSYTALDKPYDGTPDAQMGENNLTLFGVVEGEDVRLINVKLSFLDAEVGEEKLVFIESADITGKDAGNYTLSDVVPSAEATITESNGIYTKEASGFSMYPNPFSNYIALKNKAHIQQLIITDMMGRQMLVVDENVPSTIETGLLPKGLYQVSILFNSGQMYVVKMVKN